MTETQATGITIAIEGACADEAATALLKLDGIQGQYEPDKTVTRDGGLTAIATIVAIVGGTMAIAEQIRKWYAEYRQRPGDKKLDKVLIVTPNGRFLLENATINEISKALEPLAK